MDSQFDSRFSLRTEMPGPGPSSFREVTDISRSISIATQNFLWGRSAGRCEFAGCNKPLWKSSVTQEGLNIGQKAHIYSFSSGGPRGNDGISRQEINSIENLILVCQECHQKIDSAADAARYPASLIRHMKREHESRIELVTGIDPNRKSHVLLYGARIGEYGAPLSFANAASAMFPDRYPASGDPISLGLQNSATSERDHSFWGTERENLDKQFSRRVQERISDGEVLHLSVFSVAPQPLLIHLGTLLGDIIPCDVYQLHREPQTWRWPSQESAPTLIVKEPSSRAGRPTLVLSLSATIDHRRITSVLGADSSIWTITVHSPHNDLIKSREQLCQLRTTLRRVFDQIKHAHGQQEMLHVFTAAPVSACIEFGRVRMPKADMPWTIYDQVNGLGGFVSALTIS
jgi:SMODS-associated and fused to various effectors sensor domain